MGFFRMVVSQASKHVTWILDPGCRWMKAPPKQSWNRWSRSPALADFFAESTRKLDQVRQIIKTVLEMCGECFFVSVVLFFLRLKQRFLWVFLKQLFPRWRNKQHYLRQPVPSVKFWGYLYSDPCPDQFLQNNAAIFCNTYLDRFSDICSHNSSEKFWQKMIIHVITVYISWHIFWHLSFCM